MKEYLSREGISYQEKNVGIDQRAAQEMVSRSGQMGVPVTLLADQVIVGFDQPALKRAVTTLRQKAASSSTDQKLKLGAQVGDAAKIVGHQNESTPMQGAILGAIRPDSLAARAGLREGDIITAVNGQPVNNSQDLADVLATIQEKKTSRPDLTFWRNGARMVSRLPLQF